MELTLAWCLCIISIIGMGWMLYTILKKKRKGFIIPLIALLVFFSYSFFSTTGSIRLSIALMEHPIDAYTTGFEPSPTYYGTRSTYLKPTKDIKGDTGSRILYIECKTYGIIKISSYSGF
ncbi:MAG: hypothetical protein ACLROI_06595 [Beduini sp.]|uniref:hypothetical protein n=1 Tax=Beduini sp. TaxID=1922300 RepID=UPI0011CC88A1